MLHTLVPDLNIAPLKYAHVEKAHGGPVAALSAREIRFLGRPRFEAFATLDEKIAPQAPRPAPFQGAHGRGTGATRPEALFASISEALLLWAWDSATRDPALKASLGLGRDSSLSGFAAFPGLGRQGARKRAHFAAAAHWAIQEWWGGRLPHKPLPLGELAPGAQAIQIQSTTPGAAVSLLWLESEGQTIYGYASAHSALAAAERALEMLERHQAILAYLRGARPTTLLERRLLHFSAPAGAARFRERLARQGTRGGAPALLVDLPLLGPWTQYTHVWRCLFESGQNHEKERDEYFCF